MLVEDTKIVKCFQDERIEIKNTPQKEKEEGTVEAKKYASEKEQQGSLKDTKSKDSSSSKITTNKSTISNSSPARTKTAKSPARSPKSPSSVAAKTLSEIKSPKSGTATKKRKSSIGSSSASKKKKIELLETTITESVTKLEKLRREKMRAEAKVKKSLESEGEVKFPIKDELIEILANRPTGKLAGQHCKPLPEPYLNLESLLPDVNISDALFVWDFIHVFSDQLSFTGVVLEDFFDLLSFTSRSSLALTELFMVPLRFILSDTTICNKLNDTAPLDLGYLSNPVKRAARQKDDERDFDGEFNGFRLLQKKLKPEVVDIWKCQAVLRIVSARLTNTMQMQEAVGDLFLLLRHHLEKEKNSTPELQLLLNRVEYLHRWGHEKKELLPEKHVQDNDVSRFQALIPADSSINDVYNYVKGSSNEVPIPYIRCLEVKDLFKDNESINGGNKESSDSDDDDDLDNEEVLLDADAIYRYTADVIVPFEELVSAIESLETMELHQLTAKGKLALLKVLFEACSETKVICELLESNAEELAAKIHEFNAKKKLSIIKNVEAQKARREAALIACKKANEAEKKMTGAKGRLLAPSGEQISAMVEEMIFLESIGVDSVTEDLEVEPVSDDEDEQQQGSDAEDEKDSIRLIPTRLSSSSRSDGIARKKSRAQRRAKNVLIETATGKLDMALERKNEKIIKQALRTAESAGMKFNKNGKTFCTQKMRAVYKLKYDMEMKEKEDKLFLQHEKTLSQLAVRSAPFGTDRFRREYWSFQGDERLFVQQRQEIPSVQQQLGIFNNLVPRHRPQTASSNSAAVEAGGDHLAVPYETEIEDSLWRMFETRPNRYSYQWGVYTSNCKELWYLWDALDDRGEREVELKAALKARFELEEPTVNYLKTGSIYIGKRLMRQLRRRKDSIIGTVVSWLPANAEEGDPDLWHIVHPDGNEEDLEEHELLEGIVLLQESGLDENANDEVVKAIDMSDAVEMSDNKDEVIVSSSSATARVGLEIVKEEPKIVRNGASITKVFGSYRDKDSSRANQAGISGFKIELLRIYELMSDPLKRFGNKGFDRDARKIWENLVRAAESAVELVTPLLQLEALVRAVQSAPDFREHQESLLLLIKESKVEKMSAAGWSFGVNPTLLLSVIKRLGEIPECEQSNARALIGKHARRFSSKTDLISDGQIVGYLSPFKCATLLEQQKEGSSNHEEVKPVEEELFFMVHFNGNSEILDLATAVEAVKLKTDDIRENPSSSIVKKDTLPVSKQKKVESKKGASSPQSSEEEEWNEYDEPESSSESDSDDSDDSTMRRRSKRKRLTRRPAQNVSTSAESEIPFNSTLWPSAEARSRWMTAVQASKTVAELAFALTAFTTHAQSFGVMTMDKEAVERLKASRQQQDHIVKSRKTERPRSSGGSNADPEELSKNDTEYDSSRRASSRVSKQPVQYIPESSSSSRSGRSLRARQVETRTSDRKRRDASPPQRGFLKRAAASRIISYAE